MPILIGLAIGGAAFIALAMAIRIISMAVGYALAMAATDAPHDDGGEEWEGD